MDLRVAPQQLADIYVLWNKHLLAHFFSKASQDQEVFLSLDKEGLDREFPFLGGDEGLLAAVRKGPPWGTIARGGRFESGTSHDFADRLLGLISQRSAPNKRPSGYVDPGKLDPTFAGRNAPAYLPFLVALIRQAAGSIDSYYPPLIAALALGPNWGPGHMERIERAWRDLRSWSHEQKGVHGLFEFRVIGGLRRIGVPRSQVIFSDKDVDRIRLTFAQADLRPGQELGTSQLSAVRNIASSAGYLTNSLKDALSRPEYDSVVETRLRSLFGEWDGSKPSLGHASDSNASTFADQPREPLQIVLTLGASGELPWRLHWRIPINRETGQVELTSASGVKWVAPTWGSEGATTHHDDDEVAQAAAREVLAASSRSDVWFDGRHAQADGGSSLGKLLLPTAILRAFQWRYDDIAQRDELQETVLPAYGCAYLLATPLNGARVESILGKKGQVCESSGLPEGWRLFYIADCSKLASIRDELPDGDAPKAPQMLRLVGGRTVIRGGLRQYLSYDLPMLHLDAPPATRIEAKGLRIRELTRPDGAHDPGIRTFTLDAVDNVGGSFKIYAFNGGAIAKFINIRIASSVGQFVQVGDSFALDPMGNGTSENAQLRGLLSGAAREEQPECIQIAAAALGDRALESDIAEMIDSPAAKLMDSLAGGGSLPIGVAREQACRFLALSNLPVEPLPFLMRLWSTGSLELERDNRGHFTHAHAVHPTLYQLPVAVGGRHVFGVLGTLRLDHWRSLGLEHPGLTLSCEKAGGLSSWRILADDVDAITRFADRIGMKVELGAPAQRVAEWCASLHDVFHEVGKISNTTIGSAAVDVFNRRTGLFCPGAAGVDVIGRQAFRLKDDVTSAHNIYKVGWKETDGRTRYAFTRDSRWGVWIALEAFGAWLKLTCDLGDASPWPLPYIERDGTLLIPARLAPPAVLDRALSLCSGKAPDAFFATASVVGDAVILMDKHSRQVVSIGRTYEHLGTGTWLKYQWVPKETAVTVASKLGAAISCA